MPNQLEQAIEIMSASADAAGVTPGEFDALLGAEELRMKLESARGNLGVSAERAAESMRKFSEACDQIDWKELQ
jgi:hypothetical protein